MGCMKKIYLLIFSIYIAISSTFFIVLPAKAVDCSVLGSINGPNGKSICDQTDFNVVIGIIANWIIGLIGAVLAIVILVSAIQMVTSAGSPDRIKSAKDRIYQAMISLGLLISFRVILSLFGILFNGVKTNELSGVNQLLTNAALLLSYIVGGLAVVFVIIGGIQYITSGGSPDKVSSAKKTIVYALGGVLLSLSINVIIATIHTVFGL